MLIITHLVVGDEKYHVHVVCCMHVASQHVSHMLYFLLSLIIISSVLVNFM